MKINQNENKSKLKLKMKYYAVLSGYHPGIYKTWPECEKEVKGYSGAKYKSFVNLKDAEDYITGTSSIVDKDSINFYTDGSSKTFEMKRIGAGGFYLQNEDKLIVEALPDATNQYSELYGIYLALKEISLIVSDKEINIYSDSIYAVGIMKRLKYYRINDFKKEDGTSLCNLDLILLINELDKDRKINYIHVMGHSGIPGNEVIDKAVQKCVDDYILELVRLK